MNNYNYYDAFYKVLWTIEFEQLYTFLKFFQHWKDNLISKSFMDIFYSNGEL